MTTYSGLSLSADQSLAIDTIVSRYNAGASEFVLAGLAGTGKTTIIREIVARFSNLRVSVAAPTGKAAQILSSKLGGRRAETIHSLLYRPVGEFEDEETGEKELAFQERPHREFRSNFLIIDEASMVGKKMYNEISQRPCFRLWVGDHGQLAPVKSEDPGIMSRPDFVLEKIHRQSEDSPILDLAYHVRNGGDIATEFRGVTRLRALNCTGIAQEFLARNIDVLITADNFARMAFNTAVRNVRGFGGSVLEVGDRVVCLMNNREFGVFNGELFDVVAINYQRPLYLSCTVRNELGQEIDVRMLRSQFQSQSTLSDEASPAMCLFGYGYALTCHKAQGSQWGHVGVLDLNVCDPRRWYYTAVTRASERLTVFLV